MMIVPEIHGLRMLRADEAALLAEWEKRDRPYPWNEQHFLETIGSSMQQTLVWEEEEVIGFAVLQIIGEECHLMNIMVKRQLRKRGRGTQLMGKLIEWSQSCGAKVFFLDVDPSNSAAVRLYEKSGFQMAGRRPHGYPRGEELVLMRKDL